MSANASRGYISGQSPEVLFLLPRICFDSVTLVTMQYVVALQAHGVAAYICSARRSSLVLPEGLVAPRSALLRCNVLVTNLFLPDIIGRILKYFRPGLRWVPFLHCNIIAGMAGERKAFARQRIALWLWALRYAHTLIAPSRYAARGLHRALEVIQLPHCIVPSIEADFRRLAGTTPVSTGVEVLASDPGARTYVFIGRDTPMKRMRSLLHLLRLDPTARVRIVAELTVSKAAIAMLSGTERARCEIIGFCTDPYAYVGSGDIVVCPSGREGFGMVPLECLSRGIPFAPIKEGAFAEFWADTPMAYARIDQLPALADREPSNYCFAALREQFIGDAALKARCDILVEALIRNRK